MLPSVQGSTCFQCGFVEACIETTIETASLRDWLCTYKARMCPTPECMRVAVITLNNSAATLVILLVAPFLP